MFGIFDKTFALFDPSFTLLFLLFWGENQTKKEIEL